VNNAVREALEFLRKHQLLQTSDSVDPTNLKGMFGSILTQESSQQFSAARVKIWGKSSDASGSKGTQD
jgi:hypothetical protein